MTLPEALNQALDNASNEIAEKINAIIYEREKQLKQQVAELQQQVEDRNCKCKDILNARIKEMQKEVNEASYRSDDYFKYQLMVSTLLALKMDFKEV